MRKLAIIAEEANEVKSRFLANMSYNIRIPLNNVSVSPNCFPPTTNWMKKSEKSIPVLSRPIRVSLSNW